MLVVDTNVLVYAADGDSPFHAVCRDWLEGQRRRPDAWYTTWAIFYEFLRVTTHPKVMRRPWSTPEAWKFIAALITSPGLGVLVATERHATVAEQVIAELPHLAGNLLHDAHTAILMREPATRISTGSPFSKSSTRFNISSKELSLFEFSSGNTSK